MQLRSIFAERLDGKLTLRRGFTLSPSDRVVVMREGRTVGELARAEASAERVMALAASAA